jgi:hypothetical protein
MQIRGVIKASLRHLDSLSLYAVAKNYDASSREVTSGF